MHRIALAAVLALGACTQPVSTLPPLYAGPGGATPDQPDDACGAAGLQVLVGQDVKLVQAQMRGGPVRIIRPGQAVTMDFNPARLNVLVDAQGRVERISCG